jgi:hypothetical protein
MGNHKKTKTPITRHATAAQPPKKKQRTNPGEVAILSCGLNQAKWDNIKKSGGTAQGYSGMDASKGHEILDMVIAEDNTPYQMVIGDQNAHPGSMRKHYPAPFQILSATTSPTELVHSAIPRGLNPQPIDLGQDGIDFNNKGQPGCSDHPPMAFKVTLPSST